MGPLGKAQLVCRDNNGELPFPRMHRPTMRTSPRFFACVKRGEQRRQVVHDAFELHFYAVHEAVTFRAIPFETVHQTFGTCALNDQAARARLGALW